MSDKFIKTIWDLASLEELDKLIDEVLDSPCNQRLKVTIKYSEVYQISSSPWFQALRRTHTMFLEGLYRGIDLFVIPYDVNWVLGELPFGPYRLIRIVNV